MEVQTNSTSVDNVNIAEINELIQKESGFIDLINMEVKKVIVGQQHMIESLLIGLLSNGHILLEGVPGLAKTLAISTLSNIINVDFKRVQFTPDLLPADLLGTMIYNQKKEEFISKKSEWVKSLQLLRSIMLTTEMEETIKWGVPTYTINGKNIVGISAFKSYVGIWFHQGVFLKDPYNQLINAQ